MSVWYSSSLSSNEMGVSNKIWFGLIGRNSMLPRKIVIRQKVNNYNFSSVLVEKQLCIPCFDLDITLARKRCYLRAGTCHSGFCILIAQPLSRSFYRRIEAL